MNKLSLPRTLGPRFPSLALAAFALAAVYNLSGCGGGGMDSSSAAVPLPPPDKTITSVTVGNVIPCIIQTNATGCMPSVTLVTDGVVKVSAGAGVVVVPAGTTITQVPVVGVGMKNLVVTSNEGSQVVIVNPEAARVASGCTDGTDWDGVACKKVVTVTQYWAIYGEFGTVYELSLTGVKPVINKTGYTLINCGAPKVAVLGQNYSACTRYPDNLELTLAVNPKTLEQTLVGPDPGLASFVPANPSDYRYGTRFDPAFPLYDAQLVTADGGMFFARGDERQYMGKVYYLSPSGVVILIADGTPEAGRVKVMWKTEYKHFE